MAEGIARKATALGIDTDSRILVGKRSEVAAPVRRRENVTLEAVATGLELDKHRGRVVSGEGTSFLRRNGNDDEREVMLAKGRIVRK